MNTQIGSVLINDSHKIGIIYGEKFEAHVLAPTVGSACWTVRTISQSQALVTKEHLVQNGGATKWKDTGLVVNPECYAIEAFTLPEIELLLADKKLPHPMTKKEFLAWVDIMRLLAKDQHKFGQYDIGRSTAQCLHGTIQKAFFYFEITKEENALFEEIKSELWGLGYL